MAAAVPFSYAQAAKGSAAPANGAPATNGVAPASQRKSSDAINESHDIKTKVVTESAAESTKPTTAASVSGSTSSSANDATTCSSESVRDDDEHHVETPARRSESGPRAGPSGRRQEPKKGRQDKKSKDASAETAEAKPEAPKVELFEAPIPSVNVWQQRLKASTKATASVEPVKTTPTEQSTKAAKATNASTSASKTADSTETESSSRKPRGSRVVTEKDASSKLAEQIISDSTNWPTPDSAMKEAAAAPKPVEKIVETAHKESQDDASVSAKSKQLGKKVWEKVDFTPTARFETHIPSRGARAPRGGARGGREGTSRSHASASKENDKATSSGPHHSGKFGEHKERSRDANGARNNSLPPKKNGESTSKEARKPSAPSTTAQSTPAQTSQKESSTTTAPETNSTPRERPEPRGERTRGGNRGRGGYHGSSSNSAPINGQQTYSNNYASGSASRQNIVSPSRQSYTGNGFSSQSRGHGRGGRNHSISMRNGANGSRMSGQNNSNYNHEYSMHPMAPSYPVMNYVDPNQAFWWMSSLIQQISYYFSIDNLCKDVFLRKHMDSQGFVPIQFIAGFKRINEITTNMDSDPLEPIREACAQLAMPGADGSVLIEFVIGDDSIERLRCSSGWEKWVMPEADRTEQSRNAGPASFTPHHRIGNSTYMNQFYSVYQPPVGHYQPYANQQHVYRASAPVFHSGYNYPASAGNNVYAPSFNTGSQLSANVPSFSPSATSFPVSSEQPAEAAAAETQN